MSYNVFSSPKKLRKEKKSGRSRTTELPSTQLAGWPWHTFFKYKGGSYLKIYEKFSQALSRNHKRISHMLVLNDYPLFFHPL